MRGGHRCCTLEDSLRREALRLVRNLIRGLHVLQVATDGAVMTTMPMECFDCLCMFEIALEDLEDPDAEVDRVDDEASEQPA